MKQTKKTKDKLILKEGDDRITFENLEHGVNISIGTGIKPDKPVLTVKNMLSVIEWLSKNWHDKNTQGK